MTARFADVLEISLAMSVVLAVLLALWSLLKKRLRAGAFYWVWLLSALRLCIPFNLSLPQAPVTVEAVPRAVYRVDTVNSNPGNHHYAALIEEEAASEEVAAENGPVDGGSIQDVYTPLFTLEGAVAALWLAGAGAFLAWHLAKYVRFRLRVRRWGAPAEDAALLARFEAAKAELGVKNLALLVCPAVGAPLVTGFVNPALLLPRESVSDGVLRHELIHTRRRDLWYKLLLLLARSLHWFNPLVWLLRRAAERDMEIACDAAVLAGRDGEWRRRYGAALLSFVPVGRPAPLTSQFAGGARGLKERFRALMDASAKRPGRAALLLVLCAALLGGPLVACQSRAPEESLPDGTYWATLSLSDWWTAGEEGIELLLSLVEVDTDTMTLLRVAPEKTSLPVADDVTLGNHGDSGLDGFLQWAAISSYWPMVLEAEVAGGEITALTWHDASLPLDPDPLSQWEQKADHPASHYTGLPDGTYWAIPMSATDWEEAGKRGRELSLRSVTMDPDTMTVTTTDGFSGISLPVAEDVVLGGGETELSDFLNRPDWGTGAVLELEVTGGKITALTAWEARFSVEELAPDGDYIIGNLYDFRAENASGFPICFKARMYEVEEDTWRVTNLIGTSTFRVDEADLCREDGTPYEGGVLSFLNEFCADSDELYWRRHPEPYPFVNRLTLQATVRGGYITSLTRLPEPEW